MIRTLKRYVAIDGGNEKEYVELSMLSTDTKPTSGIITGSIINEVDTGKVYFFNETSAAWEEQFSFQDMGGGGGGSSLPPVTSADNGDVLAVVNGAWGKSEPPSGLPDVTASDNGKVLGVEDGEWEAVDAPSGLPGVTASDNGKVLGVEDGEWSPVEAGGALIVTFSLANTTCDKTYAEIKAAVTGGKDVIVRLDTGWLYGRGAYVYATKFEINMDWQGGYQDYFEATTPPVDGYVYKMRVRQNNTVAITQTAAPSVVELTQSGVQLFSGTGVTIGDAASGNVLRFIVNAGNVEFYDIVSVIGMVGNRRVIMKNASSGDLWATQPGADNAQLVFDTYTP